MFFVLGRDLLYWPDAMENFKMIQAKVGTVRLEESKASKLGRKIISKTSKPLWEGGVKSIQAREENHFKSIQAK